MLAKVIREKTMPPWPADYNYQHYAGERYLTDKEIKMISDWAENGAPQPGINFSYASFSHALPNIL